MPVWKSILTKFAVAGLGVLLWMPGSTELRAQDDVLRVDTRLVLVDVVVRDGEGVRLTESDFRLFDNGEEQSIAVFEPVSGNPDATTAVELPAGVSSNRRNYRGLVRDSATIILIDRLNTPTPAQVFVKQRLLEFVSEFDQTEGLALYELGSTELRILHDFKDDPAELLAIARDLEPEHSVTLEPSVSRGPS